MTDGNTPRVDVADREAILLSLDRYYSDKLASHGATARGVDWRDSAGQEKRFEQLLRGFDLDAFFTISEVGCGYGALAHHLRKLDHRFTYLGFDVSAEMIAQAQAMSDGMDGASFRVGTGSGPADYVVASGIFNVRFDFQESVWVAHVFETVDTMVGLARRGAAFNCLSGFSDQHRKEARLWYPDPGWMLNQCVSRYGRNVTLYHDYGMYEFTITVSVLGEAA